MKVIADNVVDEFALVVKLGDATVSWPARVEQDVLGCVPSAKTDQGNVESLVARIGRVELVHGHVNVAALDFALSNGPARPPLDLFAGVLAKRLALLVMALLHTEETVGMERPQRRSGYKQEAGLDAPPRSFKARRWLCCRHERYLLVHGVVLLLVTGSPVACMMEPVAE